MAVTYTRSNAVWSNAVGDTEIDADALNNIDGGIAAIYSLANQKGDIYVAVSADTLERLGVGADGEVLTADSTTPTGLKYAVPASAAVLPPGMIAPYAGNVTPVDWLLCDGAAVARSTYSDLFNAIGTTWGIGNGTTTFNLPNLQGRTPIGQDATQSEFSVFGGSGGEKTTVLDVSKIPAHTHTVAGHAHGIATSGAGAHAHTPQFNSFLVNSGGFWIGDMGFAPGRIPFGNVSSVTSTVGDHAHGGNTDTQPGFTTSSVGGSTAHTNLQPYAVVRFIIKI